jgi:hypothetical protein
MIAIFDLTVVDIQTKFKMDDLVPFSHHAALHKYVHFKTKYV